MLRHCVLLQRRWLGSGPCPSTTTVAVRGMVAATSAGPSVPPGKRLAESKGTGSPEPPKRRALAACPQEALLAMGSREPAVDALATGIEYAPPLRYMVLSRTGLTLRMGCEIDSEEAGRVALGEELFVAERRLEPSGARGPGLIRLRLTAPSPRGWLSELPRFVALGAGETPPARCSAAAPEELQRREVAAFNSRGEDLRRILDTECCDCKVLRSGLDVDRLQAELKAAEAQHGFQEKIATLHATQSSARTRGWSSIPLRSIRGREGKNASSNTGLQEDGDYEDTPTMLRCCPYIRQIVQGLEAPRVLRTRLMRLEAGGVIAPHRDYFMEASAVRLKVTSPAQAGAPHHRGAMIYICKAAVMPCKLCDMGCQLCGKGCHEGCSGCRRACSECCKLIGDFWAPIARNPLGGYVLGTWACMAAVVFAMGTNLSQVQCDKPKVFCYVDFALAALHASFAYYLQHRLIKAIGAKEAHEMSHRDIAEKAQHVMLYDFGFCIYVFVFIGAFAYQFKGLSDLNACDGNAAAWVAGTGMILYAVGVWNYAFCWFCTQCCCAQGHDLRAGRQEGMPGPHIMGAPA